MKTESMVNPRRLAFAELMNLIYMRIFSTLTDAAIGTMAQATIGIVVTMEHADPMAGVRDALRKVHLITTRRMLTFLSLPN